MKLLLDMAGGFLWINPWDFRSPGWRNRRMQIQVNIDITIVLIAILQLIRVIIIIHEENKKR